jgi:hypothetical protein
MTRTKISLAAVFVLTLLPGCCTTLCGDRPGLLDRIRAWRNPDYGNAVPVSYPMNQSGPGGCCTTGPVIIGQGGPAGPITTVPGSDTQPMPRITPPGIRETPGKQFDPNEMGKASGPVLGTHVGNPRP